MYFIGLFLFWVWVEMIVGFFIFSFFCLFKILVEFLLFQSVKFFFGISVGFRFSGNDNLNFIVIIGGSGVKVKMKYGYMEIFEDGMLMDDLSLYDFQEVLYQGKILDGEQYKRENVEV